METAKTVALVALGILYVVLALHPPEIPKRAEHPVDLSPRVVALKNELADTTEALAVARRELRAYQAAAAAAAEKEREARWAAAAEAEARGWRRIASKLYDDYARSYPGSRQAQLAAWKARKALADSTAARASAAAGAPAVATTTPKPR